MALPLCERDVRNEDDWASWDVLMAGPVAFAHDAQRTELKALGELARRGGSLFIHASRVSGRVRDFFAIRLLFTKNKAEMHRYPESKRSARLRCVLTTADPQIPLFEFSVFKRFSSFKGANRVYIVSRQGKIRLLMVSVGALVRAYGVVSVGSVHFDCLTLYPYFSFCILFSILSSFFIEREMGRNMEKEMGRQMEGLA